MLSLRAFAARYGTGHRGMPALIVLRIEAVLKIFTEGDPEFAT
jgi:hypothetical protein